METLYLALGSNIANRYENILNAVRLLVKNGIKIIKPSSLYETTPYGPVSQPNFLNIVIMCQSDTEPTILLGKIKEIERGMGRKETIKWGPRIIDIDILLYGNLV
ncbi:MAG: 2-amino-4-hydroxy-6-hydroxymethyldihydropteridine diphosphokinase, partial [Deltaproteobacteria bacterium]|nr:2-amino-4-hydroxy-6-hydroxymethyldihydropteridine diphosphokinase [Deltaproteobacteria bacterium]